MKVICIKNRDENGCIPWSREGLYDKLKVGDTYEGVFFENDRGKYIHLREFNYNFCTPWWFLPLIEWRENQLKELGI